MSLLNNGTIPMDADGLSALAALLYGREPTASEYLGGSDAQIFHDATREIASLREQLEHLTKDAGDDSCAALFIENRRLRERIKELEAEVAPSRKLRAYIERSGLAEKIIKELEGR